MYRTLILVVLVFVVSISSASAGEFDKIAGYVGTAAAVYETVRAVRDKPEPTPVASRPEMVVDSSEPRIRVVITPVKVAPLNGYFNIGWGTDQAAGFVEQRFYTVGPEIGNNLGIVFLERENLEQAIAEQTLAQNPAMDPSTFEPMGQGLGAQAQIVPTILRMTVEEKRVDFDYSEWNRSAAYRESQLLVTVWLQARVVGIGKYIVAPTAETKQSIVVRVDRSGEIGGWKLPNVGYRDRNDVVSEALYTVTDRAVEDLLCKLLPLLRPTASTREGWSFDQTSGAPIGAPKCPLCHREVSPRANYCPYDGTSMNHRTAAASSRPAREGSIGTFQGAEEYRP